MLSDHHLPDIEESCRLIQFHPIERALYDLTKRYRDTPLCDNSDFRLERRLCSGDLTHFERGLYLDPKSKGDDITHPWDNLDGGSKSRRKIKWENYLQKLLLINQYYFKRMTDAIKIETDRNDERMRDLECMKHRGIGTRALIEYSSHPTLREMNDTQNIAERLKVEYAFYRPIHDLIHRQGLNEEIKEFEDGIRSKPNGMMLLRMMRKYGTKQSMLLYSVQQILEDQDNRVIVLSIFESVLKTIKDRLHKIGIEASLCRGNVHRRAKAIKAFRGDGRVILLSTNSTASGTDLNQTTHVILVDPVPGSASESFAAEKQAVGRAVRQAMDERGINIKVIRLVIADSIEQQIHNRNQKMRNKIEDKKQKQNMKWRLMHNPNVKDRTQSEIDFYVNIWEHARKQMELLPSTKQQKERAKRESTGEKGRRKRKRNDKKELDASSDDDEEEQKKIDAPPPRKLRRSSRLRKRK